MARGPAGILVVMGMSGGARAAGRKRLFPRRYGAAGKPGQTMPGGGQVNGKISLPPA